jgi:hypothetical protein
MAIDGASKKDFDFYTCAENGLRFAVVALFPVTDFAGYRGKRATDGGSLGQVARTLFPESWPPG